MIRAAVVVVIVLAVVLFSRNVATLNIFSMLQLRPLLTGNHAIGLGTHLHVFDPLLPALQARCLTRGQAAGSDS